VLLALKRWGKPGVSAKTLCGQFIAKADERLDAQTRISTEKAERKWLVAKNANDIIKRLSAPRRKRVEARATELIAEEMTLRKIRKARKKSGSKRLTPGVGENKR
jgi:hypothetical protein